MQPDSAAERPIRRPAWRGCYAERRTVCPTRKLVIQFSRMNAPVPRKGDAFAAGGGLPVAMARMKLADFDQSVAVGPDDKAVSFQVTLSPGPVDMQTWFYDRNGREICGAHFIYVRRQ